MPEKGRIGEAIERAGKLPALSFSYHSAPTPETDCQNRWIRLWARCRQPLPWDYLRLPVIREASMSVAQNLRHFPLTRVPSHRIRNPPVLVSETG